MCAHMHMEARGKLGCQHERGCSPTFCETESSLIRPDWVASILQGSSCLLLPTAKDLNSGPHALTASVPSC